MFSALSLVEFWVTHASEDLPHNILIFLASFIYVNYVRPYLVTYIHKFVSDYISLV